MINEIITQSTITAQWSKAQMTNDMSLTDIAADLSDSNSVTSSVSDDVSFFSDMGSPSTKKKSVSFFPSVDVYLCHSGEDYDRTSQEVAPLTKDDILFVIDMRRNFEKVSLENYRNRHRAEMN